MGKSEKKKIKNKIFLKIMGFTIKFLMIMVIVLTLAGIFIDRGTDNLLYDVVGGTAGVAAVISVILLFTFPESLDEPRVKAYKFKKEFFNHNDFINYLDKNIDKIKFKKYDLNSYKDFIAYYYVRKGITRNKVEYIIVLENDKIYMSKDEFLDKIDVIRNKIFEDIEQNYKIIVTSATDVSESFVLLVNEETEDFKKIVNINTVGGFRYGVVICGYSLKTKKLYVSNQKDGQYFNYKYIRRKLLKVMNLKMKDRIKGWGSLWMK